MDSTIIIALVAFAGTVAGSVGTLLATRSQLATASRQHRYDRLIEFYRTELEHERAECQRWQQLALRNLGVVESTRSDLQQLNIRMTGGES